jgi:tripartite-type tricarboxylate transporter receptor subunit TctC
MGGFFDDCAVECAAVKGTSIMKLLIRAIFGAGLAAASCAASAQAWPTKPIIMIVPYAAGGPGDTIGRAIVPEMGQYLGQQVVIELKPGAGGNIGGELVAKTARPDGYTILEASTSHSTNPVLQKKFPFDPLKDLMPVGGINIVPSSVVVHPSVPVKTLAEFIDYAKKKPVAITYGSAGPGTTSHLAGVLFASIVGIEALHIPFRGVAPAQTALLGGQLDAMFDFVSSTSPQVRAGKLRALAVASDKRQAVLPEVPTAAELGYPAYNIGGWFGIFAPAGTPPEVIAKLNAAVNYALEAPASKKRLADMGTQTMAGTPEDFGRFYRSELDRWRKLLAEGRLENID